MKFFNSFVILIIIFNITFTKRVHRRNKNRRFEPKRSVFYYLANGFLEECSGSVDLFDKCSGMIKGWETIPSEQPETHKHLVKSQSSFDKIIGYIGEAIGLAIDKVCTFKQKIVSWLTGKYRRYIRLFIQGKTRLSFKKWSIGNAWDSVKDAISKGVNAVGKTASSIGKTAVLGVKNVGNAVVDGGNAVLQGVKKLGSAVISGLEHVWDKVVGSFRPVWEFLQDIKESIIHIYQSPIVQKLIELGKCLIDKGIIGSIKSLKKVFIALTALVPKLATAAGWIELGANLICGWKDLVEGAKLFIKGVKSTDASEKFILWGRALGRFTKTCAEQ